MPSTSESYNGVLLLDKPAGITSHDAVMEIRKTVGQRRVGHTGTLDPQAEGLMVICLGKATKISRFVSDLDKTYEGEIRLGQSSDTFDGEGISPGQTPLDAPDVSCEELQDLLNEYKGVIKQKVPAYSAVRVDGQRLYELARKGVKVDPPERNVEIKDIRLLKYEKPCMSIRVACSKGTYIRSLAHEIGNRLGCGGYLSKLKRIAVGSLSVENALTLEALRKHHSQQTLEKNLLPYDKVLEYGALIVQGEFEKHMVSGRLLRSKDVLRMEGSFAPGDTVFLKNTNGAVLAVGTAGVSSSMRPSSVNGSKLFSYIRVLN